MDCNVDGYLIDSTEANIDKRSAMQTRIKRLSERIFTSVMELTIGERVEDWESKLKVKNYSDIIAARGKSENTRNKPLYNENEYGQYVIEHSDCTSILKDYFFSSNYKIEYNNYVKKICENIVNRDADYVNDNTVGSDVSEDTFEDSQYNVDKKRKQAGNEYSEFKNKYNVQIEKERLAVDKLRSSRNDLHGHNILIPDMGYLSRWIVDVKNYINLFFQRIDMLQKWDVVYENYSNVLKYLKKEIKDEYYINTESDSFNELSIIVNSNKELSKLYAECFTNMSGFKTFSFGEITYKISKFDKSDFGLLLNDMARNWTIGIKYLKSPYVKNDFRNFLITYFDDMDKIVIDYDSKYEEFEETPKGSIRESMMYMSILYLLYPELPGIYWGGEQLSERKIAQDLLLMLTRHFNLYTDNDCKKTLLYRLNHSANWNMRGVPNYGLGINVMVLCRERILSSYYKAQIKEMEKIESTEFPNDSLNENSNENSIPNNSLDENNDIATIKFNDKRRLHQLYELSLNFENQIIKCRNNEYG